MPLLYLAILVGRGQIAGTECLSIREFLKESVVMFQGEEFLRIKKGLKDDSLDIICRYCEMFAYDGGLLAAFFNPFFYFLENAKKIQNIADLYRLFWLINIKLLRRIIIMCKNQSELIIDHWRQAFHFHPKAQKPGDQIKKDFKKKNA